MAAVDAFGVNYTKAFKTIPPSFVQSSEYGGPVKAYRDTYEAATLDYPGSIYMFRPAKGLKWTGRGFLMADALGTGVTLSVGTGITGAGVTAVVDKFLAATVLTSAARTELGPIATIDAVGYEFDGQTDVIVTTGVAAATGTIVLCMELM